jgi:hypothetical protein
MNEGRPAPQAFREELKLCRAMVVRPVVFEGLRGLAAVAVVYGDAKRAALRYWSAPLMHIATTRPRIGLRRGLTRRSLSQPERGAGPTRGTPPCAKAAR